MAYWLYIILTILGVYIAISIALYYLQDYMLFKPEKLPADFQFDYENQEIKEYNLETRDGAIINGLRFFPKGESKGVVLYLKGNSKSIKGWGKFAVDFTRHGYNVVMVDYRGFGKSTGRRSQKAIKRDLQLVYNTLKEQTTENRIILYGRSLGSGFAAKLASMNHPKMLVLDAPYYSLTKVTARYAPFMPLSLLLKYPLPTYKWLKYVKCPIHIIHGTHDKLIPFKSSIKLSKVNPKLTKLHTVIEGGHKNLNNFESYHIMLDDILNNTPKTIDLQTTSINVIHSSKPTKKRLKFIIKILLLLYVMIGTSLYFLQEKLMFFPTELPQDYQFEFRQAFQEVFLKPSDDVSLNAIHFKAKNPKGVILYFHGNAGDLSRWGTISEYFVTKDYDVFIMDYRSYGKSTGKLSEQAFYDDAQYCYNHLLKSYSEKNITIYGRSLGTGISTFLASKNSPKQLVLETPYYSILDVAQHRFPIFPLSALLKYKFPSYEFIVDVTCPITIFHGTDDGVVPYSSAKKLKAIAPKGKMTFITIEGGGHNDLIEFKDYKTGIQKIL